MLSCEGLAGSNARRSVPHHALAVPQRSNTTVPTLSEPTGGGTLGPSEGTRPSAALMHNRMPSAGQNGRSLAPIAAGKRAVSAVGPVETGY